MDSFLGQSNDIAMDVYVRSSKTEKQVDNAIKTQRN